MNSVERFDYFLIWGHGLSHQEEILGMIRDQPTMDIVLVLKHVPKSMKRLVRQIYSHDYAPLNHLKAKTRYLLASDPCVLFIFVRNKDAREQSFGQGAFKHIECTRIKALKEAIRDKFNPRVDGKRSEDHVVHASDNQTQVHSILKQLGYRRGIKQFQMVPNPALSLPYYVPGFDSFEVKRLAMSEVFGKVIVGDEAGDERQIVPIEETPHFAFLTGRRAEYEKYLSKYFGVLLVSDYSVGKFEAVAERFSYLSAEFPTSYILVKEYQPNHYLILDGLHRASILKSQGTESFLAAIVR